MKRPRARPARAARSTREGLLAEAVKLIRRARVAGDVTVRQVVGAAGANLNAVSYHFGSKEALIREAVRAIIGDWFRERGLPREGARDQSLLGTARLATDFLFARPVASRLALDTEIGASGAGPSLTRETLEALARALAETRPDLAGPEVRLRTWALIGAIHLLFLRPAGAQEWLGVDPTDEGARGALLDRLAGLLRAAP